jgi:hypothetical protein
MTLGATAAAQVRLIVWCAKHQVEPDPAEMAARFGAERQCASSLPLRILSRKARERINSQPL